MTDFNTLTDGGAARATDEIAAVRGSATVRVHPFIGVPTDQGVPTGGTSGQVLAKASNTNYDMEWVDESASGVSDYSELIRVYPTLPDATNIDLGQNVEVDGNIYKVTQH